MTSKSTAKAKTQSPAKAAVSKPSRPASKKAQLIVCLKAAKGADLATLSATFGWQPHSTRAALTGLRKAGYTIERLAPSSDGPSRYRITRRPA